MRNAVEAVIALCLSLSPHGFTASELARQVQVLSNQGESDYGARRASYDLNKLRGKNSVRRIGQTRRCESTSAPVTFRSSYLTCPSLFVPYPIELLGWQFAFFNPVSYCPR